MLLHVLRGKGVYCFANGCMVYDIKIAEYKLLTHILACMYSIQGCIYLRFEVKVVRYIFLINFIYFSGLSHIIYSIILIFVVILRVHVLTQYNHIMQACKGITMHTTQY